MPSNRVYLVPTVLRGNVCDVCIPTEDRGNEAKKAVLRVDFCRSGGPGGGSRSIRLFGPHRNRLTEFIDDSAEPRSERLLEFSIQLFFLG